MLIWYVHSWICAIWNAWLEFVRTIPLQNRIIWTPRLISYIGAKLWNDLPYDFKETTDFAYFTGILYSRTGPDLDDHFRSHVWALSDTLYKSDIFQEFYFSHIESGFHTLAYMFIAMLPWANRSVGVGYSLTSKVRLAHGRPRLCGWARLVAPGGLEMSQRFALCHLNTCFAWSVVKNINHSLPHVRNKDICLCTLVRWLLYIETAAGALPESKVHGANMGPT